MKGIHEAVMEHLQARLERDLITAVNEDPGAKGSTAAGIVIQGPLQGDPDPDVARVSVEVYENDPEQNGSGADALSWYDKIEEVEIGGEITWRRCFTVKIRCLLDMTRESLDEARGVVSAVRSRAELSILRMSFHGVRADTGEYVSRGVFSDDIASEVKQSGGPPDSYDFMIKIRFTILTTLSALERSEE